MTNWIACCGGSSVEPKPHVFRFLRWHIMKNKGNDGYIQMSEFKLLDSNDNEFDFTGVQGGVINGTIVEGSVSSVLDGSTATKLVVLWGHDYIDIDIDLGEGNEVDVYTYNKFQWYTANDEEGRDPSTWLLYGANIADYSDRYALNQEIGYQATSTRYALGYDGSITVGGGGGTGNVIRAIYSSKAQYIELPFYIDDGLRFEFSIYQTDADALTAYIGDYWDVNGFVFYSEDAEHNSIRADSNVVVTFDKIKYEWVDVSLDFLNGILIYNGSTIVNHSKTQPHKPICLFGIDNDRFSSLAMSEIKIYNSNNELVADLAPMKDAQTGAGYYHDITNNQDYYSDTSTKLFFAEIG